MGSAQSAQDRPRTAGDNDDDGQEDDEEGGGGCRAGRPAPADSDRLLKKVLQQEPEILPCYAPASPLSPQPSAVGTPRLGPSIKVWDPCHVLSPAPPPHPFAIRAPPPPPFELVLVAHGECGAALRPDLVGGRWPAAALTAVGCRQARALAVFLKSQGVVFNAVYSSPLDRARATAASVCQELNFPEEQIQSVDSLVEISQGQWEGCLLSDIYSPEMVSFIERCQPDFSAPSGESLRQVEFRMVEFINGIVMKATQRRAFVDSFNQVKDLSRNNTDILGNTAQAQEGSALPHWDLLSRPYRPGFVRKKSGKSRLQFVTMGGSEAEDDFSSKETNQDHLAEVNAQGTFCIGVFTHATPIKCLLTGLLGCSPAMSMKFCVDDSSTTVLLHSMKSGWQLKRLNDTSHLRLL